MLDLQEYGVWCLRYLLRMHFRNIERFLIKSNIMSSTISYTLLDVLAAVGLLTFVKKRSNTKRDWSAKFKWKRDW